MKRVLAVTCSTRYTGSHTRSLTSYFLNELSSKCGPLDVDELDLMSDPPSPMNELASAAMYLPPDQITEEMAEALAKSDELCLRLRTADAIVFAVPMYNFGMPSVFKCFIDNVVRSGVTFSVDPEHGYRGLLCGRPTLAILTMGSDFSADSPFVRHNHLTPHVESILEFLGLRDTSDIVEAQNTHHSDAAVSDQSLYSARKQLTAVVDRWLLTLP